MTNKELIETAKQAMKDLLATSGGKMLEHEQTAYNCLRLFCELLPVEPTEPVIDLYGNLEYTDAYYEMFKKKEI